MTRVAAAFGALLINSAYLAASSSPTLFYFSNILIHIALGIALAIVCLRPTGFSAAVSKALSSPVAQGLALSSPDESPGRCWRSLRSRARPWYFLAPRRRTCGCCARTLRRRSRAQFCCSRRSCGRPAGSPTRHPRWGALRGRAAHRCRQPSPSPSCSSCWRRRLPPSPRIATTRARRQAHRIVNPDVVPASMDQEGAGPASPFFPSSANTTVNADHSGELFSDERIVRAVSSRDLRPVELVRTSFFIVQ